MLGPRAQPAQRPPGTAWWVSAPAVSVVGYSSGQRYFAAVAERFATMTRTSNVAINVILNSVVFYVLGRKLRDHRTGLRLAVAGGIVSALVTWLIDTRAADSPD